MRFLNTLILILIVQNMLLGQSPFNYGQNKKIFFISKELRNKYGFTTIYTVNQRNEDYLDSRWKNWNLTVISFDTTTISDDWASFSMDSSYIYNFDSLISNPTFINGTRYEFTNGKLTSYGGGGYGSFDWNEITRFSDTISIVATYCVGHCGNQSIINYSKNIFDKNGLLLYTVTYPTPFENDEVSLEGASLSEFEKFLLTGITEENLPDTTYLK